MSSVLQSRWADRLAVIDARLQPIAKQEVDLADPNWVAGLRNLNPFEAAGVRQEAQDLLHELLEAYAKQDEATRSLIRSLFRQFDAFAWAAKVRTSRATPEGARDHLLHFSVRDQGEDPRDAKLWLDGILEEARRAHVDVDPILSEVSQLSSREDRYSWGSTGKWLEDRLTGKGGGPPAQSAAHQHRGYPGGRATTFDLDSAQKELQAMAEVGRLRVRAGGRAFGVGWVVGMGGLVLLGFGVFPALLLGAAIGGAIAKAYVSGQTGAIIATVCKKYDLPTEALSRERYIVD